MRRRVLGSCHPSQTETRKDYVVLPYVNYLPAKQYVTEKKPVDDS